MKLVEATPGQIAQFKEKLGIEKANCETCIHRGCDDDGSDYGFLNSWAVCEKVDRYQYLKSFPFKKEMKCWFPSFYCATTLPDDYSEDGTAEKATKEWNDIVDSVLSTADKQEPKEVDSILENLPAPVSYNLTVNKLP